MAIKTTLIDDLDGIEIPDGTPTTVFAFEGVTYEIDLAPENIEKMAEALAPFIEVARKAAVRSKDSSAVEGKTDPARLAAVRAWARENAVEVSERGRIAKTVFDAYDKARGN